MKKHGHFLTPLSVQQVDYTHWKMLEPLKFQDRKGLIHTVHTGFITDFATIPALDLIGCIFLSFTIPPLLCMVWMHFVLGLWILGPLVALASIIVFFSHQFNDNELIDKCGAVHDMGYRVERRGNILDQLKMKLYYDRLLLETMLSVRCDTKPSSSKKKFNLLTFLKKMFGRPTTIPLWVAYTIYANVVIFGWFPWLRKKNTTIMWYYK